MKTLKRILFTGLALIVVVGLIILSVLSFGNYSEGDRVGKVVKFSRKGVLFKTFEGQLNVGGFNKDTEGDISPNVWSFSVKPGDEDLQEKIFESMRKGQTVRLKYDEKYIQLDFLGDTKYFVEDVEVVEEE